jgi:hypothetical protein
MDDRGCSSIRGRHAARPMQQSVAELSLDQLPSFCCSAAAVPCDDILATGRGAFVEVHGWMPLSNPFARSQLRPNRPALSHVLSRKTVGVGVAHAESRISVSFEVRLSRAELSGAHGSRHGVEEAILTPNAPELQATILPQESLHTLNELAWRGNSGV